jgi:hypothetical protein
MYYKGRITDIIGNMAYINVRGSEVVIRIPRVTVLRINQRVTLYYKNGRYTIVGS